MKEFFTDPQRLERWSGVFAAGLILTSGLFWWTLRDYPSNRLAPADFKGPVLAVELPASATDLRWALGDGTPYQQSIHEVVGWNTVFDFPFILGYAGFLVCFSASIALRLEVRPSLKYLPCGLIVGAAVADVIENVGIFYALRHSGGAATSILAASLVKWTLFYMTLLIIGVLMFKIDRDPPFDEPLTGVLTLLFLGSGTVGLLGWHAPLHFSHGAVLFAPIPMAALVYPHIRTHVQPRFPPNPDAGRGPNQGTSSKS